jgi:two-component system response regulator FixJ
MAANPAARARVAQLSRPPLIAIVDDDAAVRDALADLLQVAGFEGASFNNGADLLDRDDPARFDIVITDLKMPKMDGIELIRRLQATKDPPPTLVLTSCLDAEPRARALQSGAAACLTKPVEEDILLKRIDDILAPGGRVPTFGK